MRIRMEKAIERGFIAWHGLPFTTHTELMDPGLFEYGRHGGERPRTPKRDKLDALSNLVRQSICSLVSVVEKLQ